MANLPHWNITPLHELLTAFDATSTHSNLTDFLNPTNAAFQNLHGFNSTSTHTSLASAGFQYFFTTTTVTSASSQETVPVSDTQFNYVTTYITETVAVTDALFTGVDPVVETVPIDIEHFILVTTFQEEDIPVNDSQSSSVTQEQDVPIHIDQFNYVTTYITETVAVTDSETSVQSFNPIDSLTIGILEQEFEIDTMRIQNLVYESDSYSMNVNIQSSVVTPVISIIPLPTASTNPPVVDITNYGLPCISPPISVTSNPFTPTVILGGVTFATNPGTAPPVDYTVTSNTYFVQWLNSGIGVVDSCTLLNFDINIDRTGGSWSFVTNSTAVLFTLGTSIPIFGLNGTITGLGSIMTNSQVGTLVSGIFGSPNLNKPLNLLAGGSMTLFAYLTNSYLFAQEENTIANYAAAAGAIAKIAGINLTWNLPGGEIPLVDFTLSEGETALSALSSLASQFGGYFLWNGLNNYTIGPPNTITGGWFIPGQSVISPSGIQFKQLLDLSTGVSGQGVFTIPLTTFDNPYLYGVSTIPPSDLNPKVQKVGSTSRQLSSSDPLWIVDLPLDTEECWVQILVLPNQNTTPGNNQSSSAATNGDTSTNGDTGGGSGTGNYSYSSGTFNAGGTFSAGGYTGDGGGGTTPFVEPEFISMDNPVPGPNGTVLNPSSWVVSDASQWFSLGSPGISNPNVQLVNVGGAIIPQAQIPFTFIPTDTTANPLVSSVNNGNFIMSVGVTRNTQQDLFAAALNSRNQQIRALLARLAGSLAFVKTYEGTINTYFFGSIPIPGCATLIDVCNTTVSGVVESVNFSYPGLLNVQVAQYAQIDFSKNFYSIDLSSTTGLAGKDTQIDVTTLYGETIPS